MIKEALKEGFVFGILMYAFYIGFELFSSTLTWNNAFYFLLIWMIGGLFYGISMQWVKQAIGVNAEQ